ncbi:MAG: pyrroloquinoline quinone-dependent dehydrogenase [Panacagrimonas sp.]
MKRTVLAVASVLLPLLANAASEWPLHGLDQGNQRLSPITAISPTTVKDLVPKWIWQSGVVGTFQATPIVVDGVMFVSLPFSHVAALDAASGRELWRYEHKRRVEKLCCGPANRGVAVDKGRVFIGTVDARLIALDAKTGKVLWDIEVAPQPAQTESANAAMGKAAVTGSSGIGIAAAPLVFEDRVIVGITGVGYGLHLDSPRPGAPLGAVVGLPGQYGGIGFLAAYDVKTGARQWRFDTVKSPEAGGWEGEYREQTPDGIPLNRDVEAERQLAPQRKDAWKFGGGSVWNISAVDAETGHLFIGTGNPSPQMNDTGRPGDNLYTSSLVAIDVRSGKYIWHWQQVPHDLWGYDLASAPVLFDATVDGKRVPAVGHASKLGWFYAHDRRDGNLLWKSEAFVPQENLFAHATKAGVRIAPGVGGGANWSPVALDGKRNLAFVAAMHMPALYSLKELPAVGDKPAQPYFTVEPSEEPRWGVLVAIDLTNKGKLAWTTKTPQPLIGGVLALASGVVFTGEGDGNFSAFDAGDGKRLWQFQCGAGVNAPPIAYESNGKPIVAVAAGGSQIWGYRQGDAVIAFELPD